MYIEYFGKKRTLYVFLSGDYICYDDLHVKESLFNQIRRKNVEHIVFKNKTLK